MAAKVQVQLALSHNMQAQRESTDIASFIHNLSELHALVVLPPGINPVAQARTQRRAAAGVQSPHKSKC